MANISSHKPAKAFKLREKETKETTLFSSLVIFRNLKKKNTISWEISFKHLNLKTLTLDKITKKMFSKIWHSSSTDKVASNSISNSILFSSSDSVRLLRKVCLAFVQRNNQYCKRKSLVSTEERCWAFSTRCQFAGTTAQQQKTGCQFLRSFLSFLVCV